MVSLINKKKKKIGKIQDINTIYLSFKIPVLSGALEKHDEKVSTCGTNNAKLLFATHEIQSNLS